MTWHLNSDREFWTRTPPPRGWRPGLDLMDFNDLPPDWFRRANVAHEAAHAVLFHAMGVEVQRIRIYDTPQDGGVYASMFHGPYRGDAKDIGAAIAAGERAHDRWLREEELWTPERAWVAERFAFWDRRQLDQDIAKATGRGLTFGENAGRWTDYAFHCNTADKRLKKAWPKVVALGDALLRHGDLDGQQIRRVINGKVKR